MGLGFFCVADGVYDRWNLQWHCPAPTKQSKIKPFTEWNRWILLFGNLSQGLKLTSQNSFTPLSNIHSSYNISAVLKLQVADVTDTSI